MIKIHKHYSLDTANTLACPSIAQYYCEVTNSAEVDNALEYAAQNQCQVRVLGGGSNILTQRNINGLVIKPKMLGKKCVSENSEECLIRFGAGENWHECVLWANANGYFGLENLAYIPGNMGAAPIQNIGAYGVELKDVFESLSAVNIKSGLTRSFSKKECEFGYRESVFKGNEKDRFIITSVVLKLQKTAVNVLHYPALNQYVSQTYGFNHKPIDILNAVISLRQSKLPNPNEIPNVGSFFKNPIVNKKKAQEIIKVAPNAVMYDEKGNKKKIAAAWLIDFLGWKGKNINGVVVHHKQALVLTNPQKLTVEYILDAALKIQQDIENNFGIKLEIEPRIFG